MIFLQGTSDLSSVCHHESDHCTSTSRSASLDSSNSNHSFTDDPSKSSSSEFSATSAADFNYRRVLSAVENLCSTLAELRAWQQAWQPVIVRMQAQQPQHCASDSILRDIRSELQRLRSSRETQNLWANDRLQAYDIVLDTILLEIEALKSSRASGRRRRRHRPSPSPSPSPPSPSPPSPPPRSWRPPL